MDTINNLYEPEADDVGLDSAGIALNRQYPVIERRAHLSKKSFYKDYVAKAKPVLISGALKSCQLSSHWSFDYLRQVSGIQDVTLKQGLNDDGVNALKTIKTTVNGYLNQLESFESQLKKGLVTVRDRPAYLHDIPLLNILPDAADFLVDLDCDFFPTWYRNNWLKFAQFFLGPSHSLTPLHFDCLLTHNLFFQVMGRKRFILLPYEQLPLCYRYKWRWCEVNAETPDFSRHPLYQDAQIQECIVEPGDMLYMPAGMLHHVRSLDCSMSFNVDWHTKSSAFKGVLALKEGMPLKNVYYNAVIALGQTLGLSATQVLPWYRSYLNYVS